MSRFGQVVAERLRARRGRRDGFLERTAATRADFRVRRPRPWSGPLPLAIAVAALLLVGTRQAFTVPYTGLGLSPAQLIVVVLVVLWIATRLAGQRARAGLGVLTGLILVRLMLTLVSYGLGAGRLLTLDQRTASDRAIVTEAVAALTVIVLATLLRSRGDIELVLRMLVVGGALSGLFAMARYATGIDLAARLRLPGLRDTGGSSVDLLREGLSRAQGSAATPLELGAVMAVLMPLGLGVFFAARRRGEPRSWVWMAAVALMAGGGVVSLSRSVFLAFGLALVVMMLRWPLRRVVVTVVLGVTIVLAALASGAQIIDALGTVFSSGSDDYSLGSRSDGRAYVWSHFAHHFWFGQGVGTYDQTIQPVLDNQYLSQLMETGVLGLIMLIGLLLVALAYALRATARPVPPDARELAVGVAGALAALLVIDSVLDTAGFAQIFSLGWFVIALAAALWRLNVADARRGGRPVSTGPAGARPSGLTPSSGVRSSGVRSSGVRSSGVRSSGVMPAAGRGAGAAR